MSFSLFLHNLNILQNPAVIKSLLTYIGAPIRMLTIVETQIGFEFPISHKCASEVSGRQYCYFTIIGIIISSSTLSDNIRSTNPCNNSERQTLAKTIPWLAELSS